MTNESIIHITETDDAEAQVRDAYRHILQREPDPMSYQFYHDGLKTGILTLVNLYEMLLGSTEYIDLAYSYQAGAIDGGKPVIDRVVITDAQDRQFEITIEGTKNVAYH